LRNGAQYFDTDPGVVIANLVEAIPGEGQQSCVGAGFKCLGLAATTELLVFFVIGPHHEYFIQFYKLAHV
jgi:hypothetical protein